MPIDIDHLTEAELIDLNNRIVERLRFLNQMRSHKQMLQFRIGDRVAFQPAGRPMLTGILTRYNKKTVTIVTDGGAELPASDRRCRERTPGQRKCRAASQRQKPA
jgi:hypothetical protein